MEPPATNSFFKEAAIATQNPSVQLTMARALSSMKLTTPARRAVAFASAIGFIQYVVQPRSMFTEKGTARPWKLFSMDENATHLPFFLLPTAGAILGYMFL